MNFEDQQINKKISADHEMRFIVRRFFTFKFRISNIIISKFLVVEIDLKIRIKMQKSVYKAINRLFLIW